MAGGNQILQINQSVKRASVELLTTLIFWASTLTANPNPD